MKKLLVPILGVSLLVSASSCTRCYVCRDKDSDTFTKVEFCDKDFDKGDINERIEDAEDNGATCHAKMRAF